MCRLANILLLLTGLHTVAVLSAPMSNGRVASQNVPTGFASFTNTMNRFVANEKPTKEEAWNNQASRLADRYEDAKIDSYAALVKAKAAKTLPQDFETKFNRLAGALDDSYKTNNRQKVIEAAAVYLAFLKTVPGEYGKLQIETFVAGIESKFFQRRWENPLTYKEEKPQRNNGQ